MNAASVSSTAQSTGEAALHRFTMLALLCDIAAIVTGAMQVSSGNNSFQQLHQILAGIAALAVIVLGIWMAAAAPRKLGISLLVLVLAQAGLGAASNSVTAGILHACIAPLIFSLTWVAMIETGARWKAGPEPVEDHGWPSLNSLGKATPVFVLGQIALGAAFRHKAMSVLPHLLGAMLLVLIVLCLCIFVMQQFPQHRILRPAANQLIAIAFTQIFLGIAAFTVLSMNHVSDAVMIGITATHALVGSMTLGAAMILAVHIGRNVYRKPAAAQE